MDQTRENVSFRPIISSRRVLGRVAVFVKKVIRKLTYWYVDPICTQQTVFNNAVTPSIGRLNEMGFMLTQRQEAYENENEKIRVELTVKINELNEKDFTLIQRQDECEKKQAEQITELTHKKEAIKETVKETITELTHVKETVTELIHVKETMKEAITELTHKKEAMRESLTELIHKKEVDAEDALMRIDEKIALNQSDEINRHALLAQSVAQIMQKQSTTENRHDDTVLALRRAEEQIRDMERKLSVLDAYDVFKLPVHERRSYAQTGEDMILAMVFDLLKIPPPSVRYLDLGANHAKELSNTYYFYRLGARGVLVEANPTLASELKLLRCGDVVLNKCIAEKSGDEIPFYILNGDGLSTPNKEMAENFTVINTGLSIDRVVNVGTITVGDIITQHFQEAPDLLNVDIEGKEEAVLRSIDFDVCRPTVIICEMIPYMPNHLLAVAFKNQDIMDIMTNNGYMEYAFTGINSIFIDRRHFEEAGEKQ
jgi:FkbM family methyltransferase